MPASWYVAASRWLNGRLGHSPQTMLCARLYAQHHRAIPWVDALFLVLRGERDHCAAMYRYEHAEREMPDRARDAGL